MSEQLALSSIKPGEEVAMRLGMSDDYTLFKVKNVSTVRGRGIIEIETGSKYRLDGSPVEKGGKWNRPNWIQPVTDEIKWTIRKNKLVGRLARLNYNDWKALSLEKLEALVTILDAEAAKGTED